MPITLHGRQFGTSHSARPQSWVNHAGRQWPAEQGYPLRVLVDIAAGNPGRLTLIKTDEGLIAWFAGTDRSISIDTRPESGIDWKSVVHRLSLSSEGVPVSFEDIEGVETEVVLMDSITLPPVLSVSEARKKLAVFGIIWLTVAVLSAGSLIAAEQVEKIYTETDKSLRSESQKPDVGQDTRPPAIIPILEQARGINSDNLIVRNGNVVR